MSALVQIRHWSELSSWAARSIEEDDEGPWPWVELSTLLVPVEDALHPKDPAKEVGLAGVRWYGEGVFERERRAPENLSSKYSQLIQGALVYNRLFAWKQSFAVVDAAGAALYASSEFPQFLARSEELNIEFAALVLTSTHYAERIFRRSTGSTAVSRNRLKVQDFLMLKIPLPPREVQDDLVATAAQARADSRAGESECKVRRSRAWEEFENGVGITAGPTLSIATGLTFIVPFANCDRWDTEAASRGSAPGMLGSKWKTLGGLATVSGGIQKSPSNRPRLLARPYLRVANVKRGRLDLSELKTIDVAPERLPKLRLEPGDLLFVEGNGSADEIGRSALWSGEVDDCVHQNHLIKARITSPDLDPHFALAWFNSSSGRRHFKENARTTSGLLTLNLEDIRSAPVPMLPFDQQQVLARRLWGELGEADILEECVEAAREAALQQFAKEVFGE